MQDRSTSPTGGTPGNHPAPADRSSDGRKSTLLPLIVARDADLTYPGTTAPSVAELSLRLDAGELVIVLGPNGGGKTTLFRAFTGELAPSRGEVLADAEVAYLPQDDLSRTDFPVTALDVTLMGTLAERRSWRRAGRAERERALLALERVGLRERASTAYGDLSGGQRRRVLLARTIVQPAAVILLDEPMAGVDPASAAVIEEALFGLRDEGRLVVVASHDIEQAMRADRVLCVNGRLLADGPPAEALTAESLRQTYATELTLLPAENGSLGVVEHHHHHGPDGHAH